MTLFSKVRTFFADDTIPTGLMTDDLRRSIQQELPMSTHLTLLHPEDNVEEEIDVLEAIEEGLD
jgi:hypothetical protein